MELTTTEGARAVTRRPAFALRPHQEKIAAGVIADIRAGKPETLLAACPGFGKTETAIGIISDLLKCGHLKRVLVLAHGTKVLRTQFQERLERRRPDLLPVVHVKIPHQHRTIEGAYDLVVVDEAHGFYEVDGGMVDRIIESVGAKQALLLTGTPSIFIKRGLKPHAYALRELYTAGWASDLRVILSRSAYDLTDEAWNDDGELRNDVRLTRKATETTLNTLIADLSKHCDLAKSKTIIACRNVAMARQLSWALKRRHRIEHLVSEHKEDRESANIEAFRNGNCPVLVVVRRASLGFDLPALANFVDLTGSRNPDIIFQMVCRLVRKPDGPPIAKNFVKAMPPVFAGDVLAHFMTGVLMLGDREFFTTWDGGSMARLPVRVRVGSQSPRAPKAGTPSLEAGMMVFGDLFARMDTVGFATTRLGELLGLRSWAPLKITIDGRTQSAHAWAREAGLEYTIVWQRWRKGVRGSELVAPSKRSRLEITIDGRTQSAAAWALEAGLDRKLLCSRWHHGVRDKELLRPTLTAAQITIDGRTQSLAAWAREAGISTTLIGARRSNGTDGAALLAPPSKHTLSITIEGRTQSASAWAREAQIATMTVLTRWHAGVRGQELLERRRRGHHAGCKCHPDDTEAITIDGRRQTRTQWARETGISLKTVTKRWRNGVRGRCLIAPATIGRPKTRRE